MKVDRIQYAKKDERGEITDIMVKEKIDFVTMITSVKGSTRGNHYHKETDQWVYILSGRIKMLTRMPDEPVIVTILEKGDLAKTGFMESHAMIALEDTAFMVFTRGPRGAEDYETDTYRLPEPLSES
jgi:oxalate decarboxylase/phosphoglucose isomerase-like protein (cupin superfamily)